MYDLTGIEDALQEAFGQIEMVGSGDVNKNRPHHQIKVAVTTTETTTSKCSLLTTYNKANHEREDSYLWAQEFGALSDLKVWEA